MAQQISEKRNQLFIYVFGGCISCLCGVVCMLTIIATIYYYAQDNREVYEYTNHEKTVVAILTNEIINNNNSNEISGNFVTPSTAENNSQENFEVDETPTDIEIISSIPVTITLTPTLDLRLEPKYWREWQQLPIVSNRAKEIYQYGLNNGNDEHAFSVIGDCLSDPYIFMGLFDDPGYPLRHNKAYLRETIDNFQGSFSRKGAAVENGLSAPAALSPLWSDEIICENYESPVDCEIRIHRPSIVFINLGTNTASGLGEHSYEYYLRLVVDKVVINGAVPILSTKADNIEGDYSINRATAQVAYDYDVPLWNFWSIAQDLLYEGLDPEKNNVYLTPDGFERHSFTALESLDVVWKGVR